MLPHHLLSKSPTAILSDKSGATGYGFQQAILQTSELWIVWTTKRDNMHSKLPICILTRHSQFETTERREKGTTQIIKMKCKSHMEELEVLK